MKGALPLRAIEWQGILRHNAAAMPDPGTAPAKSSEDASRAGPLPGAKPPEPSSFLGWLKGHRHLVTFIGALIIFLTFVVKEGLREELRVRELGIERAVENFYLRLDINNVSNHVIELEQLIDESHPAKDPTRSNYLKRFSLGAKSASLRSDLHNSAVLLMNLPDQDQQTLAPTYVALNSDITRFDEEVSRLGDAQAASREKGLSETYDSLFKRLSDLEARANEAAEKLVRNGKARYEIYNWISYCLYTLGWGLGLLGRFVGAHGAGEG
jgi:hypothetical protein